MTYKINSNIAIDVIEYTFDRLPKKNKLEVIQRLRKKTAGVTLKDIFKKIDARRKKLAIKITTKDILKEIAAVRREMHARRR